MISHAEAYSLYANDYLSVDGVEAITFTPRNPAGDAVEGVQAKRQSLKSEETDAGVAIIPESKIAFTIWDITLEGALPDVGDLITDADNVDYVIRGVVREYWDTRWRADCRREVA